MSPVPFDKRDGFIWYDGEIMPWQDAKLHVLTHGLHYGSSIFEGERAYNGRIFRLREHSDRFIESGRLMGFRLPYSAEELDRACEKILEVNNLTECYVRPVAWRGSEMMAVAAQNSRIHVAIAAWVWAVPTEAEKRAGIRLGFTDWKRPHPETAPTASKAAGLYMIGTLAKHQAEANGFDDAMMLDWRGHLAESSGANMFLVIDGALHTPIPDCFLNGITRQVVIALAREQGITVVERHMPIEDLARATEVFLTGTAAEVKPVREIQGHHYKSPGPITEVLMRSYDDLVRATPRQAAA